MYYNLSAISFVIVTEILLFGISINKVLSLFRLVACTSFITNVSTMSTALKQALITVACVVVGLLVYEKGIAPMIEKIKG